MSENIIVIANGECPVLDEDGRIITPGKAPSGGGAVDSVNGKTGAVVLDASDVGALPDTYEPPAAPVSSVNGRTGAVTVQDPAASVAVSGTNPSITLADNTVFTAGELASLTLTGSLTDTQSCVIVFTSGSTATQLTVPAALMLPDSFAVEADKIYELSIMGNRGAVQSWAST